MTLHAVKQWAATHGRRVSIRQTAPAAVNPDAPWLMSIDGATTLLDAHSERDAWREAWGRIQAEHVVGEQLTLAVAA